MQNVASHPFDDKNADVILRSSDQVDFYTSKHILRLVSPIFRDMFTYGQPTDDGKVTPEHPIVDVQDDSSALDCILRLCYPIPEPTITTVAQIGEAMKVAEKYEIEHVIGKLKRDLKEMAHSRPSDVFAMAWEYNAEDIAKEAASTLFRRVGYQYRGAKKPRWELAYQVYSDKMACLPAAAFHRLLEYIENGTETTFCKPKQTATPSESVPIASDLLMGVGVDLFVQSHDGIIFKANQSILSLLSPVLAQSILHCTEGPKKFPMWGNPVLGLEESGEVLDGFFKLLHAATTGQLTSHAITTFSIPVLQAAIKYEAAGAIVAAKNALREHIATDPLTAALVAISLKWKEEAEEAALGFSRREPVLLYVPLMEDVTVLGYKQLLRFRHEFRKAIMDIDRRRSSHYITSGFWDKAAAILSKGGVTAGTISSEVVYLRMSQMGYSSEDNMMRVCRDFITDTERMEEMIRQVSGPLFLERRHWIYTSTGSSQGAFSEQR